MPTTEPKVFIIILNWNGKEDTLACLNSSQQSTYFNQEIVVVDNGSSDDSVEQIKLFYPSVTLLETGQNLGYAEGNNVGIRYALEHHADYILLLNNDTTVARDLLDQLVSAAQQNPDAGVFGATLLYMDKPDTIWFAGAQWNTQKLTFDYPYQDQKLPDRLNTATDYACGAALFFRGEVARSIGLLDARFFLVWEESDWCLRATRAGYGCKLVPSAYVWHKVGASFDGESSPLRQYFSYRNRLLWAEKNLSLKELLHLIKDSFGAFCPKFTISQTENTPLIKRLVWSINGWKINWFSPILRAKRRGIIDYFFRNFGDCPEKIRALNRTYAKASIKLDLSKSNHISTTISKFTFMHSIPLSNIFKSTDSTETIQITGAKRSIREFEGGQLLIDQFDKVKCTFLRLKGNPNVELLVDNPYEFQEIKSGGYLGTPVVKNQPYLWFPDLPKTRWLNVDNFILSEELAPVYSLSWDSKNDLSFQIRTSENSVTDGIIWQFDEDFSDDEIISLLPIEYQGYFLWGSHGCINKPADLYRHLIHGAVYDLRYSWPHNKKCFSENEAHALYTVFSGLEKTTGKAIYRYFQQQLVLSLIQRQSDDGGWYHGMWTDSSECHYRLHTSGVHLLMDEFQRTGCPQVKTALQKAVAFLSKTTDQLNCGIWFLHDSLELSEQAMNSGPFKWIARKTLGKSISNMLVLNTHLDTSIALNRYGRITGDNQYQDLVASALNSTRAVLAIENG